MIRAPFIDEWKWPLIIAGIFFLLSLWDKAWHTYRQRRAQAWPISYGQITAVTVHHTKHEFMLKLWYSYPVPDEPYPVPADFQKEFYLVEEASRWADALCDKTVPVRVDPANSWKSQLLDSDLVTIVEAATPGQVSALVSGDDTNSKDS
jgi:hypothetical protein